MSSIQLFQTVSKFVKMRHVLFKSSNSDNTCKIIPIPPPAKKEDKKCVEDKKSSSQQQSKCGSEGSVSQPIKDDKKSVPDKKTEIHALKSSVGPPEKWSHCKDGGPKTVPKEGHKWQHCDEKGGYKKLPPLPPIKKESPKSLETKKEDKKAAPSPQGPEAKKEAAPQNKEAKKEGKKSAASQNKEEIKSIAPPLQTKEMKKEDKKSAAPPQNKETKKIVTPPPPPKDDKRPDKAHSLINFRYGVNAKFQDGKKLADQAKGMMSQAAAALKVKTAAAVSKGQTVGVAAKGQVAAAASKGHAAEQKHHILQMPNYHRHLPDSKEIDNINSGGANDF